MVEASAEGAPPPRVQATVTAQLTMKDMDRQRAMVTKGMGQATDKTVIVKATMGVVAKVMARGMATAIQKVMGIQKAMVIQRAMDMMVMVKATMRIALTGMVMGTAMSIQKVTGIQKAMGIVAMGIQKVTGIQRTMDIVANLRAMGTVEIVNASAFSCHSGRVDSQRCWLGMPQHFKDQSY